MQTTRFSLFWLFALSLCLAVAPSGAGLAADEPKSDQAAESSSDKADEEGANEQASDEEQAAKEGANKKRSDEKRSEEMSPAARRAAERSRKREEEAKKVRYAWFEIDGVFPESPGGSGPFGELSTDLRKTVARIDEAGEDDKIQGLVVEVGAPQLGSGQQHEVRQAIKRFREKGKRAVALLETAESAGYLIACACDEIVMPESGYLVVPGVRAQPLFFKGMLAKLGLRADFVHVGEAKGAAEPFTRRDWSEPVEENMTALIDDLYEHMVDTITMERPMTRAAVVKAIDRGLLTASQAEEVGLVDRLAYGSSLRGDLEEQIGADSLVFVVNYGKKKVDTDFSGPAGFFKLMGIMAGAKKPSESSSDALALVYAVGPIMTGESEVDPFGSSDSVGSTTIVNALREAADDDDIKAIVLRVDSPGGSAVASDLIWRQVRQIEKPVVASMGNVAASGGYYISMGCDYVYAEPTTVTGSIGVVGGKVAINGLLDKIGITTDLVARGENSGMFSLLDKFSDTERERLVGLMEETYDQFTAKAAEGRGLSQERVKELGGGKVYTGRQAKRLGLVDDLGDLHDAMTKAKELAGIDPDKKLRLETYPEAVDFFESLFGTNDEQREVTVRIETALLPELEQITARTAWFRKLFAREPIGLVMPFDLRLE
ncbi:signal peptide peptidase SppA [Botrimarina sp.]|uniref:signal peptide peptidase SppA n=1 Tax=Botrimarina sp. TaxID=2795802 RepID=UPI0032EB8C37